MVISKTNKHIEPVSMIDTWNVHHNNDEEIIETLQFNTKMEKKIFEEISGILNIPQW